MALNKKIESAFTKNKLVDYELGYSESTSMAAEPVTEYLAKPEIENEYEKSENLWKKQQKI